MPDCPYGTMEWYCCLPAGHRDPHRSHTTKPTVRYCDVEGCTREAAMFSHNSRTGSVVRCVLHMRTPRPNV